MEDNQVFIVKVLLTQYIKLNLTQRLKYMYIVFILHKQKVFKDI